MDSRVAHVFPCEAFFPSLSLLFLLLLCERQHAENKETARYSEETGKQSIYKINRLSKETTICPFSALVILSSFFRIAGEADIKHSIFKEIKCKLSEHIKKKKSKMSQEKLEGAVRYIACISRDAGVI